MKTIPGPIGLTPQLSGLGGMVSFQLKLRTALKARGIATTFDLESQAIEALLIIGGTRRLRQLRRLKANGLRIVQRLDGINWIHRKKATGPAHWIRSEAGNWLLKTIRQEIAQHVVYQSQFVHRWWLEKHGELPSTHSIIHNGVDLDLFNPQGPERPPDAQFRLLVVEGNLRGGYEIGLESAVHLAEELDLKHGIRPELSVAGQVPPKLRTHWEEQSSVKFQWLGVISNSELPLLYRSAHALFSADINAACPNSVIEALACGLPVLAFRTGALPELVTENSGRLADYGGDPWNLDPPDIAALAEAAIAIFQSQDQMRKAARARAVQAFGLDQMLTGYLDALGNSNA